MRSSNIVRIHTHVCRINCGSNIIILFIIILFFNANYSTINVGVTIETKAKCGCLRGAIFDDHSILEEDRIPSLKSHGQELEQKRWFHCVLCHGVDASVNLTLMPRPTNIRRRHSVFRLSVKETVCACVRIY